MQLRNNTLLMYVNIVIIIEQGRLIVLWHSFADFLSFPENWKSSQQTKNFNREKQFLT